MSMVERVARAIWSLNEHTDCPEYGHLSAAAKARADGFARAAIEAMREPTEAMRESGQNTDHNAGCSEYWRAMIDAALAEPTPRPPAPT